MVYHVVYLTCFSLVSFNPNFILPLSSPRYRASKIAMSSTLVQKQLAAASQYTGVCAEKAIIAPQPTEKTPTAPAENTTIAPQPSQKAFNEPPLSEGAVLVDMINLSPRAPPLMAAVPAQPGQQSAPAPAVLIASAAPAVAVLPVPIEPSDAPIHRVENKAMESVIAAQQMSLSEPLQPSLYSLPMPHPTPAVVDTAPLLLSPFAVSTRTASTMDPPKDADLLLCTPPSARDVELISLVTPANPKYELGTMRILCVD